MSQPLIQSTLAKEDVPFENTLRPRELGGFIGQDAVRERLQILLDAARMRQEALCHCLFCGPPGLGKTTLAHIMARGMGTQLVVTSGPVVEKAGDLAGLLTQLKPGDVLFIDEIHRMNRVVEEYLYSAMEDFVLDLMIDSGPSARSVQVRLHPFTLIGATTRAGLLSSPLRSRFGFTTRLDYYAAHDLETIVTRSSGLLDVNLEGDAAMRIAQRARGTPRIANNLTRWVRDFATSRGVERVHGDVVERALALLAIDEYGLEEMDRKILQVLVEYYQGGPVGLKTLAVAVGEEAEALEEVYEPFLVLQGYIKRTARGRMATPRAYALFGQSEPSGGCDEGIRAEVL
ncbi:MAG: Holliday junction branch migration DNA helicase RuvB [Chlamydiia bacterium]